MMLLFAAVQKVQVMNWPTPTPTPKITSDAMLAAAQELNRATWRLDSITLAACLAAAASAVFLFWQLQMQLREQRLARATDLERSYFSGEGDSPSVFEASRSLIYDEFVQLQHQQLMTADQTQRDHLSSKVLAMYKAFTLVNRYFARAAYLYQRNLIDRKYFLDSQWATIISAYAAMGTWYDALGEPPQPGLDYLVKLATKHKANLEKA